MHQPISSLLLAIEKKLNLGSGKDWPNQYFQKLSEQIFSETDVLISPSTLKRLFGKVQTTEDYQPQQDTKDALARFAGYKNWNDFNQKAKENTTKRKLLWYLSALGLVMAIVAMTIFYFRKNDETEFSYSFNHLVSDFPSTTILKYHIKHRGQVILDNKNTFDLLQSDSVFSMYFKLPAYLRYQIVENKIPLLDTNLLIKSKGTWGHYFYPNLAEYNPLNILPAFIRTSDIYFTDKPNMTTSFVHKMGLDTNKLYWTEHRLVTDSIADGDNFELAIRWRNRSSISTVQCNHAVLCLAGAKGNIKLHFVKPGCAQFISLELSENTWKGNKKNLSAFEHYFKDFETVYLKNQNKTLEVKLGGKVVLTNIYKQKIGVIKGIYILFSGTGEVENLEINHNDKSF